MQLEQSTDAEIRAHEGLVRKFADFLHSQSITVAYDLLVRDLGVANIMRWCQQQIEDSDYLILVVTLSLRQFLDQKCPPDKEPLFSSDYLYNLIHNRPKNREGKTLEIIPLFLFSALDLDCLPMTLRASSTYEVWDREYRQPLSEGLTSLLCRLTGQIRHQPPSPQAQIIIAPRKSKCESHTSPFSSLCIMFAFFTVGPKCSSGNGGYHHTIPPALSQNHSPLDKKTLSRLALKEDFSRHWKKIATEMGLSEADIERCDGWGGGDVSEACLQMFKMCAQQRGSSLTVASLSDAISRSGYHYLYTTLQSVL